MSLVPCHGCQRHIRVTEPACPFCATAISSSILSKVIPGSTQRLSRAAAFAFTATLAVAGCERVTLPPAPADGQTNTPPTDNAAPDVSTSDLSTPDVSSYDVSPSDASMTDAGTPNDGGVVPAYGGPPMDVLLTDVSNDSGPAPLYGGPPMDVPLTDVSNDSGPAPLYGAPPPRDVPNDDGGGGVRYGAPPALEMV